LIPVGILTVRFSNRSSVIRHKSSVNGGVAAGNENKEQVDA
jgi:hypothetical protein